MNGLPLKSLKILGVKKYYRNNLVLKDINFTLDTGSIVGIVGENGAGKSTLLKIIVGLLKPSAGSVSFQGTFGYCPQGAELFSDLSVLEHFEYFRAAYNLERTSSKTNFLKLCERYKLQNFLPVQVHKLSAGTQQKLNLVLSLFQKPDFLILDEPYTGFDWECYNIFWQHTKDLLKTGTSILIVSHLIHDHGHLDRLLCLSDGVLS